MTHAIRSTSARGGWLARAVGLVSLPVLLAAVAAGHTAAAQDHPVSRDRRVDNAASHTTPAPANPPPARPNLPSVPANLSLSASGAPAGALPGTFAFRMFLTKSYLSSSNGSLGTSPTLGPGEKFFVIDAPPYKSIQAANGERLIASRGYESGDQYPGHVVLGAPAQGMPDDKLFTFERNSRNDTYAASFQIHPKSMAVWSVMQAGDFRAPKSNFVLFQSTAMAMLWPYKCDELGSGPEYLVRPAGGTQTTFIAAKLLRQPDGSYVFAVVDPVQHTTHYMTAIGGGGYSSDGDSPEGKALKFDRTAPKEWEHFKVVDQGNCTYAIGTSGGWFIGWKDGAGFSTRISDPKAAPSIGYQAVYELIPTAL